MNSSIKTLLGRISIRPSVPIRLSSGEVWNGSWLRWRCSQKSAARRRTLAVLVGGVEHAREFLDKLVAGHLVQGIGGQRVEVLRLLFRFFVGTCQVRQSQIGIGCSAGGASQVIIVVGGGRSRGLFQVFDDEIPCVGA